MRVVSRSLLAVGVVCLGLCARTVTASHPQILFLRLIKYLAWATRTLIVRSLKGLESFIGITVVSPRMGEHGWPFAPADEFPGAQADPHHEDSKHVKDLYLKADPNFSGRSVLFMPYTSRAPDYARL